MPNNREGALKASFKRNAAPLHLLAVLMASNILLYIMMAVIALSSIALGKLYGGGVFLSISTFFIVAVSYVLKSLFVCSPLIVFLNIKNAKNKIEKYSVLILALVWTLLAFVYVLYAVNSR